MGLEDRVGRCLPLWRLATDIFSFPLSCLPCSLLFDFNIFFWHMAIKTCILKLDALTYGECGWKRVGMCSSKHLAVVDDRQKETLSRSTPYPEALVCKRAWVSLWEIASLAKDVAFKDCTLRHFHPFLLQQKPHQTARLILASESADFGESY